MKDNMNIEAEHVLAEHVLAEHVLIGDISKLTEQERTAYYISVCKSLNLNPLTKPFDYIQLNGKLTLYAKKDATDQLRAARGVSISKLERETINGVYCVTAYAETGTRSDASLGAVNIENLKGDTLANAMMKAETKAKRRVTLSICGLGMLDETELETIHELKPQVNSNGHRIASATWSQGVLASIAAWSGKEASDVAAVLNLSQVLLPSDSEKLITDWVAMYIAGRKEGMDSKASVKSADSWLVFEKAKTEA